MQVDSRYFCCVSLSGPEESLNFGQGELSSVFFGAIDCLASELRYATILKLRLAILKVKAPSDANFFAVYFTRIHPTIEGGSTHTQKLHGFLEVEGWDIIIIAESDDFVHNRLYFLA